LAAVSCCHLYEYIGGQESVFAVDPVAIRFGPGALAEAGPEAAARGLKRVAIFTDPQVAKLEAVRLVEGSLRQAGVDTAIYAEVRVEPTDRSFQLAARFELEGRFDGFVSVGGGSTIDTCKAANLYSTYPADFLTYVNVPIGDGRPVPGPLKPHIACPTTSGTGSESTAIAVFDLMSRHVKTGIAARPLRPTLALIDPTVTATLPANVVASSGFDVLSHALESYTASPFTGRPSPVRPDLRPMSQGANPWSDIGCAQALRLTGEYLVRAVRDATDTEARQGMMWAATLAGIAFGNSGVHLPHAMAYSVAGLIRDYHPAGFPGPEPICPHGISVIVNAPSVFRTTARALPARHADAALWLGADTKGAGPEDAGETLVSRILQMMRDTAMPNGIGGLGYTEGDVPRLTEGASAQQRLLTNAPIAVDVDSLAALYRGARTYW
jgi:alcohol dehydrogenase class IV